MSEGDLPLLRLLFRRLSEVDGAQDRHLALAMGIDPAQLSRWRAKMKTGGTIRLNNATRDAIASLGSAPALWGMEEAARQIRATVDDLEGATKVRRAFLTPEALDDLAAAGALIQQSRTPDGQGEQSRKAGGRKR